MSHFFPEYFRVDMSQEDIDNGIMGSMTKCALALAVGRELDDFDISAIEIDEGRVDFVIETLEENDTEVWTHHFYFMLDEDLYLHTVAFDLNKDKVKPVKIHFNVTEIEEENGDNRYIVNGDAALHEDFELAEVVPTEKVIVGTRYVV